MQLDRLFRPASIAVVGATDRPGSYGNAAVSNLLAAGFEGRLVGVHPTRDEVRGVPCVRSLDDIGEPVDAVVIATPADTVPGAAGNRRTTRLRWRGRLRSRVR